MNNEPFPFLDIDDFIALCDDDAELALHIIDSHMIELDIPELTAARRSYLDTHHYTDSTLDEISDRFIDDDDYPLD